MLNDFSTFFCTAVFALSAIASAQRAEYVPGAYIVQVDDNFQGLAKRQSPEQAVDTYVNRIARGGIRVTNVRQQLVAQNGHFSGFSITTQNATMDQIAATEGVVKVWPVRIFRIPQDPTTTHLKSSAHGRYGNPDTVVVNEKRSFHAKRHFAPDTGLVNEKRGLHAKRQSSNAYQNDYFPPHVMSGVNKTLAAGNLGTGQLVCVIDTGVDYTNPILGACFGPGCHIKVGYDFVGDNYTGTNTPQPDADPYTNCSSHGTHVTGTIGALANDYGFAGVAPGADLGHYRIFSCLGATSEDIIIAAIIRAWNDRCTVLNLSIGAPGGWSDGDAIVLLLAQYNTFSGGVAVAAQGDSGTEGLFDAQSPGNYPDGIAVGANVPTAQLTWQATIFLTASGMYITYAAQKPLAVNRKYPIVFLSTDPAVTNDGCTAISQNLAGTFTIVKRGGCTFNVKFQNIKAAGGSFAAIYNSQTAASLPYLESFASGLTGVVGLTYATGSQLQTYYAQGQKLVWVTVTTKLQPGIPNTLDGGQISPFSTFGPSNDMMAVPAVIAPGTDILSTFPVSQGGIGVLSGSSMSTPFIAGAFAVLRTARAQDNLSPWQMRSLLTTTATPVTQSVSDNTLVNPVSQGGGLIQLDKAIASTSIFTPDHFNLNDTAHFAGFQTLRIINRIQQATTYTFSFVTTNALNTYADGPSDILINPQPAVVRADSSVSFSSNPLVVPPLNTGVLQITFTPPAAQSPNMYPVYGGFIVATDSRGNTFRIPYSGLNGNLIDFPVLDSTNYASGNSYPFISGPDGTPVNGNQLYSISAGGVTVHSRLAFGTRKITVDLIAASSNFTGTVTTGGGIQSRKRSLVERAPQLYSDVVIYGNMATQTNVSRDELYTDPTVGYTELTFNLNGTFKTANGNTPPQLNRAIYKILVRALRVTADPIYEASWDSWVSPILGFRA